MKHYPFLEPLTLNNGITLKNKIVMSPMTTMSSFYNGMISDDELDYYSIRSSGPGMVITAVANVTDDGKGFEGELSVSNDDMIPGLKQLADVIKKDDTKAILQIFHAGRKSNSKILRGNKPVAPSSIAAVYPVDSETPKELTDEEIHDIIKAFGQATKRAILAGFDGVELHGANTYLLQQFYSENSNQRTDKWGGSREKRLTFAMEVLKEVHEIVEEFSNPSFIIGYRMSPEEIEKPGITLEDSLYFADKIKNKVSYLHLSIGSYKRTSLNNPNDKTPIITQFAKTLDNQIPLIGVGSVESPEDAEHVLSYGGNLIAIGRELIREPKWVQKVQSGDLASLRTSISPFDLDELKIPRVMQTYLKESFYDVMNFTTDKKNGSNYQSKLAPMEGFEKKL
ncbi:NADH-dependent flavin oxidoreductase [Vagococcus carniphilus]|uniref:NADH-dependent flavin oxidoreductase n=1 Tax=Vagococcus carniphilus TaxID=218144 RepID=A0A430B8V8_9ENTE|nr:NADH-dependent flavin oxidoreductase [Vagococcus carniphilus]QNN73705.1 NADH-dependent flavin oxidoreductase [Vagococcus carniphilus]RSU16770.1 NADH-dependent flavin oxidoreductase [Vagococcus carniphilus]